MNGESHARLGPTLWFAWCAVAHLRPEFAEVRPDVAEVLVGGIVASSTSHGWLSPDMDGHRWLGKVIPGGHRGPLHMPDLVAATGAGLLWLAWGSPAWSMLLAILCAWIGHIGSDAAFGRVPVALLGGRRVGLSLDTGGWFEVWIVRRMLLVTGLVSAGVSVWVALGMPMTVDSVADTLTTYVLVHL